ncbi:flippase activity-associated protein Agl23 [Halorhabdus amylolytica]|uniref:flippase activity-associated protein Agl23 n=1 Tax=Halorhabdus amylolytica TaxID=2559573 RepID=UPI0010AAF4C8|nr:flippase activity-associated protein Agl23 [Halorhabdus amylolytica]
MSEAADAADSPSTGGAVGRIIAFVRAHPVVVAVVALTIAGLVARFAFLGFRVAHWDEARVAHWVDYTRETGHFAYRYIIHGPFIQHADRVLFDLLGTNDFATRVPVAIVGGLLPLAALLYRDHLDDVETVVLAAFLSANPVLLYYSRFMRSDLLVTTFMFATFGFLLRFHASRKTRYLYAATVTLAFGVASKENAILYVLTWLGAGALLLDATMFRPRNYRSGIGFTTSKLAAARERVAAVNRSTMGRYVGHAIALGAVFGGLFVVFFAPRGAGLDGLTYPPADPSANVGLWDAIGNPTKFPELVGHTLTYGVTEYVSWGGGVEKLTVGDYLTRIGGMAEGMALKAGPLVGFAVVGFFRERYAVAESRPLVLFMFYAGVASMVGYPLALSIDTGWAWGMTHVLVPLAIVAAAGLGTVCRWGLDAYRARDRIDVGLSVVVVGLVGLVVVSTALTTAYAPNDRADDNPIVQYAQPGDNLRPVLDQIQSIAPAHDGTDVLVYDGSTDDGGYLRDDPGSADYNFRPVCTEWGNTLPLNWYFVAYDAETDCMNDTGVLLERTSGEDPVPVVITRDADPTVPADELAEDYHPLTYQLRTHGSEATFYVHEDFWNRET